MAWNPSMSLNPEFVRSLRTSLPRRRALFVAGLTLALVAAGAWLIWNESAPSSYAYNLSLDEPGRAANLYAEQVRRFGSTSYVILTVALFALLFMLGPAMAGLSFVQERLRGTVIFQQMSLLSPWRLAAGKFWGAGALAYFVALMLLPFALVAGWLGDFSAPMMARVFLFLLFGGFAWQALGLYVSAALCGPSERALRGGLLVGPLVAVGGAVTALALSRIFMADYEMMEKWLNEGERSSYYYDHYEAFWWHFYGARVPAYAVVLGLLAFAGLWAFVGAIRRVKAWQLIPTGPRTAWLFLAGACALVMGLLWGRHLDDVTPVDRLQMFMLLGWAAVTAVAGGSALTRGRLREWWSVERDPLALLQRSEIKASVKTILVAAGVSLAGLFALWASYHFDPPGGGRGASWQLLPVALSFALTLVATVSFVQFCAMFRFRLGGWAGVALLLMLYIFAGVAGMMLKKSDNTAALLNPIAYTEVVTKGNYYLDSSFNTESDDDSTSWKEAHPGFRHVGKTLIPTEYTPRSAPRYNAAAAATRGLVAQSAFALLFLSLAYLKYQRTRREMLRDAET